MVFVYACVHTHEKKINKEMRATNRVTFNTSTGEGCKCSETRTLCSVLSDVHVRSFLSEVEGGCSAANGNCDEPLVVGDKDGG